MKPGRDHHYRFVHTDLPRYLWQGDSLLGILANPDNQDFLRERWDGARARGHGVELVDPAGLGYQSFWLGGEHLVFLLRFPTPMIRTEAYFAAITTSPRIRYLTLERGEGPRGSPLAFFCEWTPDMNRRVHSMFPSGDPRPRDFLELICAELGVPSTIDEPTREQQEGMSKGRHVFFDSLPEAFDAADSAKIDQWTDAAFSADDRLDFVKSEECYRKIIELATATIGARGPTVTHAMRGLAYALEAQGKMEEAEGVLLDLWRTCRRWRMLGHAETMFTIQALADHYRARSNDSEAGELLLYAALLASLTRGVKSPQYQAAQGRLLSFQKSTGNKLTAHPTVAGDRRSSASTTFGEFFRPWIGAFPIIGTGGVIVTDDGMAIVGFEPAGGLADRPIATEDEIRYEIPWRHISTLDLDVYREGALTIRTSGFEPRGAIYFVPKDDATAELEIEIRRRLPSR